MANAPRQKSEKQQARLRITDRIQEHDIGDGQLHGTPHPLPYQEGLRFAGVCVLASIAFEDSRTGVQSSVAAGIPTIGIRTSLSHADLVAAGAIASASAFDDPELLARLASAMAW